MSQETVNLHFGVPDPSDDTPETWNWLSPGLAEKLEFIRDKVKEILKEHHEVPAQRQLQHFTPHNQKHLAAVEDLIHRLLLGRRVDGLTDSERFFLLGSAWLHDLGMIRGIFPGDRHLSDHEIRADHHIRSAKYIQENHARFEIDSAEADVFAVLAHYHRRRCSLYDCKVDTHINRHNTIRLRLLSAYLRLADSLDIDYTRAPDVKYAISLTYDIPRSSKLHWLRSRFVNGVDINHERRQLIVNFRTPSDSDTDVEQTTLESIFDTIIQDLEEELESVKSVLLFYGLSYFLEVKREMLKVPFDASFRSDIKSVLNYYFLMENPSSSALSRLMLESLIGIVDSDPPDLRQEVERFLQEVEQNVLSTRSCHVGLRKLTNEVYEKVRDKRDISPQRLSRWAKEILDKSGEKRKQLRANAADYLTQQISSKELNNLTILLYGYSELAIKALCGFRDAVKVELDRTMGKEPIPNREEARASNCFNIFVCEGQPKNHTAWGGRVAYHDGVRYAQSLSRRGFRNIYIIPDAIAGTLFLHLGGGTPFIDYIIIGANGFDQHTFVHSAGHSMIAGLKNLAVESCTKKKAGRLPPRLVLATLTDKFNRIGSEVESDALFATQNTIRDGWTFKGFFGNEKVRMQPFFAQDERLFHSLQACENPVLFYNPREDRIPIKSVDVAITEEGWFDKNTEYDKPWNGLLMVSKGQMWVT